MTIKTRQCPICLSHLEYIISRYPNAICEDCRTKDMFDSDGFPVSFENESLSGGFISIHNIDGTLVQKQDHICWIDNIKCYADEGRFGDIVIIYK